MRAVSRPPVPGAAVRDARPHGGPPLYQAAHGEPAAGWVSLHVFHQGSLDALLVAAVLPLARTLMAAGRVQRCFFLRYWEGGPHLRLRLLPASPDTGGQVQRLAMDRMTDYLAAHPSPPPRMTQPQYDRVAARFAGFEGRRTFDPLLHPCDSAQLIPYQRDCGAYGGQRPMAAFESHFTESSQIAGGLVAAEPGTARRAAYALPMLAATVAACDSDLRRASDWFGSYAKTWSRGAAPVAAGADKNTEAGFERGYQRQRAAILRTITSLWPAAPGTGPGPRPAAGTPLAAWRRSVHNLRRRLVALHEDGLVAPLPAPPRLAALGGAVPDGLRASGPVLMLHCAHLMCNRLGVPAADEPYLQFLVARGLSDAAGGVTA